MQENQREKKKDRSSATQMYEWLYSIEVGHGQCLFDVMLSVLRLRLLSRSTLCILLSFQWIVHQGLVGDFFGLMLISGDLERQWLRSMRNARAPDSALISARSSSKEESIIRLFDIHCIQITYSSARHTICGKITSSCTNALYGPSAGC